MKLLCPSTPEQEIALSRWMEQRVPRINGSFYPGRFIGFTSDDEQDLLAVVAFNRFDGRNIEMSIASDSPAWASRRVILTAFAYPFLQLGCVRVTATTLRTSKKTRNFLERLGFRQEGTIRKYFVDGDAVVYGMLREECKWLRQEEK